MISQDAPEVLEKLRGVPFDCYRIALAENQWLLDDQYPSPGMYAVFDDEEYTRRSLSIYELRESIQFWGDIQSYGQVVLREGFQNYRGLV